MRGRQATQIRNLAPTSKGAVLAGERKKHPDYKDAMREKLSDEVLREAAARYGIRYDELKELQNGFTNLTYEYVRDGRAFTLRLTHSTYRESHLIEGELDWIRHLHANGARVSAPVMSSSRRTIECVPAEEGYFSAVSFEKALGEQPGRENANCASFLREEGRLMGQLHALTKDYVPTDHSIRRPEWQEERFVSIEHFAPTSEPVVLDRYREMRNELDRREKSRDSYGLVHLDIQPNNSCVSDGEITLFDFDCCAYGWFSQDIGNTLHLALWLQPKLWVSPRHDGRESYVKHFMMNFMAGYQEKNSLAEEEIRHISLFASIRNTLFYLYAERTRDFDRLGFGEKVLFASMREQIVNREPFVRIK